MERTVRKRCILMAIALMLALSGFGIKPVFVSPKGSDSSDGTLTHPFLTIEKARDVIRDKRSSGEKGVCSILLRGGSYCFAGTLNFEKPDKNLVITPYKNEKVRFTGGISIDPAHAVPVAGSAKQAIFPEINRKSIFMVSLRDLGITDYGNIKQVGFSHPLDFSWMELLINGKPGHLSRWPNDSTVLIEKVLEKGSVLADGDKGNLGGKFIYPGNRPSRWKSKEDIWITGYFHYGWADDAVKLDAIDTLAKTFSTAQPHMYGFVAGSPWNAWYAYNIPEEIDNQGEYYIDRKEGILYFYNTEETKTLELSLLGKPLVSMNEASGLIFQGIAFECSRGIALEMKSSSGCLIKNCTIRNMGSYAAGISDNPEGPVGKNNGLRDCVINQTGAGGIHLGGGDRKTLNGAGNYVENCSISNYNRISKTYCAGVQITGVGNRISHCEIFNAPHFAIQLSGNDHLIEYNNIHDVCMVTDDVGALYYGRNPSERGHLVQFNYFHNISDIHSSSAIYHDDGACGMKVFGNVFYMAGSKTVLIGGGSDNPYVNNIFIDCKRTIDIDDRLQSYDWAMPWIAPGNLFEKSLNEIRYNQPPYSIRYPELARYWKDNPGLPKRNVVDRNIFVRIGEVCNNYKRVEYSENNLVVNQDPGFVSEKDQNFMLKSSSEVFKKVPGFQQVPFDKMGIVKASHSRIQTTLCNSPDNSPDIFTREHPGSLVNVEKKSKRKKSNSAINGPKCPLTSGSWQFIPELSDEFNGKNLDTAKWYPSNPGWLGRPPGYFSPKNVSAKNGYLTLTSKREALPGLPEGYHTYTTAAVKSKERMLYGYYEIRCKPMDSRCSSAFWFYAGDPDTWTEIDVFELCGKNSDPEMERKYFMTAHVMKLPGLDKEVHEQTDWKAPFRLADNFFICGFEWNEKEMKWYVNGKLIKTKENIYWHQSLNMNFDSETMPGWFGLPAPEDPEGHFEIDYVRVWKKKDVQPLLPLSVSHSKEQPLRHRLIHNCDGTIVMGNFLFKQRPLSLADVNAYVDTYANTQVTTFMMCSGSDYPYYRSKYGRVFGDDRNGTLDCGRDTANYKYMISYYRNHLNLEKEGTDIIDACLRRAKEKKMETFITYRMNDLHFNDTTTRCPVEYTDFWLAHPQYWLNEDIGWKSKGALNYVYKEVREQKLNMISEQLDKYGDLIDGYDLDFMRFPAYFKSDEGVKNAPLMTGLVRAVRAKVDELSAKRGKKILLSARVPPDLEFCMRKGFDVKEWINQGLIDFVTIGIFYTGNPAMPVARFKESLGEPSVPVYATIDDGGYKRRQVFSHGMFRGMASHILAQGGDGIYLFNYFFDAYLSKYNRELHLEDGGYVCSVIMPDLLHEMGSLETLRKRNKIYFLDDGGSNEFGYKSGSPVPMMIDPGKQASATIYIGDNLEKDVPGEVILFLRTDQPAQFGVYVNNVQIVTQKPEDVNLYCRAQGLQDNEKVYAYIVPASCLKRGDNEIRIHPSGTERLIVKRMELALKYGDVKTHGYF